MKLKKLRRKSDRTWLVWLWDNELFYHLKDFKK